MPNEDGVQRVAGRYALGARLGSGGMGTVWHGRDELLNRDVAIKQIHIPDNLPPEEREAIETRVLREARAAAQLNHPSAVSVFDVAQEGGQAFIVMELVTAPTLSDLLDREGPLSPERAAEIGLEVLDALGAAHASGIVHRDVKPANVMVPEEGSVKLADFGIAALADDPRITSTGLILGSPAYMAPEQAQEQDTSPATDMWGLGATLFFAVGGRPPFEKPNPIATLTAVLNDDIEMPESAGALGPVIASLLAKDAAERPTAARLRPALEDIAGTRAPAPLTRMATETQEIDTTPAPETPAPTPLPTSTPEPIGADADDDDDEAPLHDRRRSVWFVIVAALAAGSLFLFMMLNQEENPAGPGVTGDDETQEDTVPADWEPYTDDATGYRLSYPNGWDVIPGPTETSTDFRDEATGTYLRVDWQQPPGDDAVAAWEAQAESFAASHENYQELRIEPTTFQGFEGAEWEFTYTDGGADLHALDLGFIVGDDYGFALFFQTHAENWESSQDLFESLKASFRPPS